MQLTIAHIDQTHFKLRNYETYYNERSVNQEIELNDLFHAEKNIYVDSRSRGIGIAWPYLC